MTGTLISAVFCFQKSTGFNDIGILWSDLCERAVQSKPRGEDGLQQVKNCPKQTKTIIFAFCPSKLPKTNRKVGWKDPKSTD